MYYITRITGSARKAPLRGAETVELKRPRGPETAKKPELNLGLKF
jgi:hypothetical protein